MAHELRDIHTRKLITVIAPGDSRRNSLANTSKAPSRSSLIMNQWPMVPAAGLSPAVPLTRRKNACRRCHAKKIKCEGDRPCRNCALSSSLCVFPSTASLSYPSRPSSARDTAIIATPSYHPEKRRAEEELHSPAARRLLNNGENGQVARRRGEYLGDPSYQLFAETIIAHIEFRESTIRMQNRITTIFDTQHGDHSALSIVKLARQVSPHVFDIKRKHSYVPIAPTARSSQMTLKLPPKDYTLGLLAYMEERNDFLGYSFFRRSLRQRIIDMYNNPHKPENKNRNWLCKLLGLVAIGELQAEENQGFNSPRQPDIWNSSKPNDQPKTVDPPGLEYFRDAIDLLPKLEEEPTLEYIEVLCLLAYYSYALNRQNEAYGYIGLAIRTSLIMGIHQNPSQKAIYLHPSTQAVTTGFESEVVNRVWWTVYIMNQIISAKVGLPLGISDSDITAEPPGTIFLTEEETAEFYPARTFIIHLELMRLRHEMTTSLYEYMKIYDVTDDELVDPKGSSLVSKVLEYHSKLVYWEHNLPEDLKICIHRDGKVSGLNRSIATIYLCYYQVATVVLRPILDLVFNQLLAKLSEQTTNNYGAGAPDLCLQLSHQVQKVCEQTVADACNMMKVMEWLFNENLIGPYNYWDCNHAFSSAVTILMAELIEDIAKASNLRPNPLFFINKEATKTAMERATKLLEFQQGLGNVPAVECMELLRNLRAKVDGFLQVLQARQNAAQTKLAKDQGPPYQLDGPRVSSVPSSSPSEHEQGPLLIQLSDDPHRPNSFIKPTPASIGRGYESDLNNESSLSTVLAETTNDVNNKGEDESNEQHPLGNVSCDFASSLWDNHVSHYEIWNEFENPLVDE